ncbi:hypothetical protein V3C99_010896, partial [Haemonchus contortus]|uniref:Centromere protein S n=1 Tax=Haemonchus contortus TaxID=6289 RepID=A0A7I4Z8X2_HAECO
ELQKSIQVSVLKSADDVCEDIRTQGGKVQFDPGVVAHVSALVWDTVSSDWTSDLLAFSNHAGRETVNVSDVMLILRRNRRLLDLVSTVADIDIGEYERPVAKRQRVNNKESRAKRADKGGTSKTGASARKNSAGPASGASGRPLSSSVVEVAKSEPNNEVEVLSEQKVEDDGSRAMQPAAGCSGEDHKDVASMFDDMGLAVPIQVSSPKTSTPLPTSSGIQQSSAKECSTPKTRGYRRCPPGHQAEVATGTAESRALKKSVIDTNKEPKNASTRAPMVSRSPEPEPRRSSSPDLFGTPVKVSENFDDDDWEIPVTQRPMDTSRGDKSGHSRCSTKNIDVESKKTEGGWSAKFSEFSFLDTESTDAAKSTSSRRPPAKQSGQSRQSASGSRDTTKSTTPKQISSTTPKSRSARPLSATLQPDTSCRSRSRSSLEKSRASSRGSTDNLSQRIDLHSSMSAQNHDSDDDFFDL